MSTTSTLRITHRPGEGDTHSVTVSLSGENTALLEFTNSFDFALPKEDRERIQWYLETYLQYPQDPAPTLAQQVEGLIADTGKRLFDAIFEHDKDTRRFWARLEPLLPDSRIEVASERETGWPLPWELLRDSLTNDSLAVRAKEFVRSHSSPSRPFQLPQTVELPIRVLLVICRPGGRDDVPFHSVARKLVAVLGQREDFQLDVLRPPTFDALAERLRTAKSAGMPYHIVHFDGHGVFVDLEPLFEKSKSQKNKERQERLASLLKVNKQQYSPESLYPGTLRSGNHGYLAFENPHSERNMRLVDGPEVGGLLNETNVPILILNACRSARAFETDDEQATSSAKDMDRHERVRAFGSLAQEVMDSGVPGVLAMRYNVYVVTAAEFVGNLYTHLAHGETFGVAASAGRKHLKANPLRAISYGPVKLEDWMVPVVYEANPLRLVPEKARDTLKITVKAADATPGRGDQVDVPPPPDHGFFGRDETLLALDRAFDTHQIVLLQGYAGSGKTTAATEFARWYSLTGGVEGPVLFTSFERYLPLPRVLDTIERVFGSKLEQAGVHWLTLDDEKRCEVALRIFKQKSILWIWDNVEPVAGFPAGTESDWRPAEQTALLDFLRALKNTTKAKVLLTSRRNEKDWLGDLPVRIKALPMPMQERVQLARALAEKHDRRLTEVADWKPLLHFSLGNPMAIQ